MSLKQRESMRGGDLATPRNFGKGNPALEAQISQPSNARARAGMIGCAYDLERLSKEPLIFQFIGPADVITQADRCLASPDQTADLAAGRGAQGEIDAGVLACKLLHDGREPPARQRAHHRERDRPGIRMHQRANRILCILSGCDCALRVRHHHFPCVAEHGASRNTFE